MLLLKGINQSAAPQTVFIIIAKNIKIVNI